jgi:hypothetical protein
LLQLLNLARQLGLRIDKWATALISQLLNIIQINGLFIGCYMNLKVKPFIEKNIRSPTQKMGISTD